MVSGFVALDETNNTGVDVTYDSITIPGAYFQIRVDPTPQYNSFSVESSINGTNSTFGFGPTSYAPGPIFGYTFLIKPLDGTVIGKIYNANGNFLYSILANTDLAGDFNVIYFAGLQSVGNSGGSTKWSSPIVQYGNFADFQDPFAGQWNVRTLKIGQ